MDSPPLYPFSLQRMRINYWAGIQLHTRPIIEPADWHLPERQPANLQCLFCAFSSLSFLLFPPSLSLSLFIFQLQLGGLGTCRPFQFETEREIWVTEILSSERAHVSALLYLISYIGNGKKGLKVSGLIGAGTIIVPFFLNFLNKWEGINDEYRRQR